MKKIITFLCKTVAVFLLVLCLSGNLLAQQVLYSENFGTPVGTTLVQEYTGWQDNTVHYYGDGTCDVRVTSQSSGYGLASGGGNVMLNDTVKWLMIAGVNTLSDANLSLYCGLKKTTAENGSHFVVEASVDSLTWQRLALYGDTLPTGTGTSGWQRVRYVGVPACSYLYLRFSNCSTIEFRLDDISIVVGEENVLQTVATPTFAPSGGTYYEPQVVTISSATAGAQIFYTMDGSTPTVASLPYQGTLTVNNNVTIKALAVHDTMYNSTVATASYVILDTNSLVTLPFDISDNSDSAQVDIVTMPGFRGYHLGSSYADGSVKFEAAHAGEAALVAHLDSAPGVLSFDLKGKKGGSSPAAYEDVTMEISQSLDGHDWRTVAILNNEDIIIDNFVNFTGFALDSATRYIRWRLLSAAKGNTQLNNIAITQWQNTDTTAIVSREVQAVTIAPNPTHDEVFVLSSDARILSVALYDLSGKLLLHRNQAVDESISLRAYPAGVYLLRIATDKGMLHKKILKY